MTLPLRLRSVQSSIWSSVQLGSATRLQTRSRMTSEVQRDTVEQEQAQAQAQHSEDRVVRRDGALRSILRGLFWPFGVMMRAYRGVWWVLGFRQPQEVAVVSSEVPSPARQSLAGRKRLHRVTRLLLSILPRWVQGALGYPVSSSIGRSLSPEIRVSPTKPCGKGSKRKQDELDEDEEEEHPTWVEALNQELASDEDPEEDPDYEPSTVETESEEYCSHNNTESDIEISGKGVVIEDVNVDIDPSTPVACPPV
ncbi:oogenesis-related [Hippoglossus stenolepis]|uniref:oogenesis-related n=1 Tax=Hippoglossus stenolepis TaxID=195615 RepID=UPI001FAFC450|nr:oogenesis-related [Hippoglossus stenolepis]